MTPEFAYFLKVNVAFVLFYAFYRLLFYKDTFFKLRRASLLAFFGLALLYPLLNIQDWVKEQEPMTEVIQIYSAMLPEMTVTPEVVVKTDWKGILLSASSYMYWGVMALLFVRFFIQLSSILLLAYRSRRTVIHGVPVYRLDKPAGPFSFFKMIFIHPESHSEKEIDEILTHECTHVFQWHSVDVMICELITVICWVNPFAWLLKREVRHNLEYLADNTVIQSGYDCKSYQYHLLGLAHHYQAAATLYNSFNVLHLKNRISMMNKKRSHGIGRTKYLIFIPLAAFLMLLSNIEAVARITGEIAAEAVAGVKEATEISVLSEDDVKVSGQVIDDFNGPVIGANVIVKGTNVGTITDTEGYFVLETTKNAVLRFSFPGMKAKEVAVKDVQGKLKVQLYSDGSAQGSQSAPPPPPMSPQISTDPSDLVFTVVEVMPEFPGGQGALLQFLAKSIKYPVIAQQNGIQGRVTCSFVVGKDGVIRNIEVIRGVDPSLDLEATRVISMMPKWKPGMQKGKEVSVKYTVPVTFRLQGKEDNKPTPLPAGEGDNEITVVGYGEQKSADTSGQVFAIVEKMPQFPGGEKAINEFISKTLQYPVIAQENGIQGKVVCSFIINQDGSVTDAEVVSGVDPSLDREALRIVSAMPKWTPGTQRGKAVRVKYTMPVTFTLQ
ncbi:M56 family metallopeptidase [Parabacteroides goldsteinii]|uniref:TonB family protein n=1 Tax=Parabacteroides goldsteinii TaxID=328812 RepID=A0A6G1Z765_9BACT|nr:M56 family metallopeptidase [Parabacteroides goldsteinii]MCS2428702.1 M56 family metallopeptidase [Parabacteroides goldsteinii]MRX90300.1 TonB family protein [Parabacteroides goldsteinii]MRX96046.1 TonB family protein [Parabacteroides goldsteinii]MRY01747.1 TonB family protein [Parabacteroides goldsteinii]MRY09854.1 TonB family protein [Parabacteroides goldsteinii]